MFEEHKIKEINRAVLVGLSCPGLSDEENAGEESLEELAAKNPQIRNPNLIRVGEKVKIA